MVAANRSFEVKGLRELGAAMKDLGDEVGSRIARGMTNQAAQLVKAAAVANIIKSPSVDKGHLRDSVIVKKLGRGESDLTAEYIVTVRGRGKKSKKGVTVAGAPDAHFVEFGTVNMPAEPFLRPALDNNVTKAVETMKRYGEKRIEAAARKAAKGRK